MTRSSAVVGPRVKAWLLAVLCVSFVFAIDRVLKVYYYSQTYGHYEVGDVYWEDSKSALLFAPDRYLF